MLNKANLLACLQSTESDQDYLYKFTATVTQISDGKYDCREQNENGVLVQSDATVTMIVLPASASNWITLVNETTGESWYAMFISKGTYMACDLAMTQAFVVLNGDDLGKTYTFVIYDGVVEF